MQGKGKLACRLLVSVAVLAVLMVPISVHAAPPIPGVPTKVVLAPYGLRLREDPSLAAPVRTIVSADTPCGAATISVVLLRSRASRNSRKRKSVAATAAV